MSSRWTRTSAAARRRMPAGREQLCRVRRDDSLACGRGDLCLVETGDVFAIEVDGVGAGAGGGDSARDVDLADLALGLERDDVGSGCAELAADRDLADRAALLDAQANRLQRHLHALDEAQ